MQKKFNQSSDLITSNTKTTSLRIVVIVCALIFQLLLYAFSTETVRVRSVIQIRVTAAELLALVVENPYTGTAKQRDPLPRNT